MTRASEILETLNVNEASPKVGDRCMADYEEEGDFNYGKITKIEDGMAWTDMKLDDYSNEYFCGDVPTKKEGGVWVFTSF